MATKKLSNLGALVRKKRGELNLREAARQIGIGPSTLMRVENGRIPDIETFGKLCHWLGIDPGKFLGFDGGASQRVQLTSDSTISLSAHFRADRTPKPATVTALAKMILLAIRSQQSSEVIDEDEHS